MDPDHFGNRETELGDFKEWHEDICKSKLYIFARIFYFLTNI